MYGGSYGKADMPPQNDQDKQLARHVYGRTEEKTSEDCASFVRRCLEVLSLTKEENSRTRESRAEGKSRTLQEKLVSIVWRGGSDRTGNCAV